jgi:hypothetical protein
MERHINKFTLWILCVDKKTFDILSELKLNNVKLLQLEKFEKANLLAVKANRNKGEYCWTLTPFAPKFVFESDSEVDRVTYLDADLWFRKQPQELFDELNKSGKHVLITDHAYAPEYDQSKTSGQYCVQFMTFNKQKGEIVRKWWEERCIEWCFNRYEDGKFGDQMYLDDWPLRFKDSVHVLKNKELTLAPWNATRFPYGNAVFFHFHGLRLINSKKVYIGQYQFPKQLINNVYLPYLEDITEAIKLLESNNFFWVNSYLKLGLFQKIKNIIGLIKKLKNYFFYSSVIKFR